MAGDIGIKVSQEGKDAQDSGDQDLLFSSSWPNLKIIFNGRIKATTLELVQSGVSSGVVMKHNLGFVPFFIVYGIQEPSDFGSTSTKDEYRLKMDLPISADKTNIYISYPTGGPSVASVDIGLIIFDLNIEENFKAPSINTGTSSGARGGGDVGIKVSKENKDVSSKDLRDFVIHSRTRSPMVHEVFNVVPTESGSTASLKDFVYTHDLPYNPMFFIYGQASGFILAPNDAYAFITSPYRLTTSQKTITLEDWVAGKRVSIVVLKDPFIVDDNINKVVI